MDRLTFRRATASDGEFAYQTKKAAFRDYVEQVWGWDEDEQRRFHNRRFDAQEFRVIQLGATPIGVMAVVRCPDCLKVNQLFLLPGYQGRGIGTECMKRVIEEAGGLGVPVRLRVLRVNGRARAFYERLGFRRTGETDEHIVMERGG